MMDAALRADVFMTLSDDMLVFLDLAHDRYCALGRDASRAAQHTLAASGAELDGELVRKLEKAGLLVSTPHRGRAFTVTGHALPVRDLRDVTELAGPVDALLAVASRSRAARALRRRHISEVVAQRRAVRENWRVHRRGTSDEVALVRRVSRLAALRPLASNHNACLLNSLSLLFHLGRSGADVDWVFAVKAVPFEPHCWVQLGDMVLNDTVEGTRGYAPIMVV